jgi:hypothetical protein
MARYHEDVLEQTVAPTQSSLFLLQPRQMTITALFLFGIQQVAWSSLTRLHSFNRELLFGYMDPNILG